MKEISLSTHTWSQLNNDGESSLTGAFFIGSSRNICVIHAKIEEEGVSL